MENLVSGNYDLEIYPTTFSGVPNISVSITTSLGNNVTTQSNLSQSFLLNAGQTHIVDVPGYLEMVGIELASKAVLVSAG